jgi:hypothetical protein
MRERLMPPELGYRRGDDVGVGRHVHGLGWTWIISLPLGLSVLSNPRFGESSAVQLRLAEHFSPA